MDIFSHGLWPVAIYKAVSLPPRKPKNLKLALFFGLMPDLFSFGFLFVENIVFNFSVQPRFIDGNGTPIADLVPDYIHYLYNFTHSLIVFTAVFGLIWLILRRPVWEIGAWGIHILMDIPTHTDMFFPTPFLWPVSMFTYSGVSWGGYVSIFGLFNLPVLVLSYALLGIFALWLYKKTHNNLAAKNNL